MDEEKFINEVIDRGISSADGAFNNGIDFAEELTEDTLLKVADNILDRIGNIVNGSQTFLEKEDIKRHLEEVLYNYFLVTPREDRDILFSLIALYSGIFVKGGLK